MTEDGSQDSIRTLSLLLARSRPAYLVRRQFWKATLRNGFLKDRAKTGKVKRYVLKLEAQP